MSLPTRIIEARQDLERHLETLDWSGLTNGKKNVLNAFLKVASTQGYAAATMREIGRELNLKAPSIYSHFPGGRDEIVADCLRWHYYNFGVALIEAVRGIDTSKAFLEALITVRFTQQLLKPESDLWDLLIASDDIGHFLKPDIRGEVDYWMMLCSKLYEAAATELYSDNIQTKVKLVLHVLDGATGWCTWDGTGTELDRLTKQALSMSKAIFAAE